MMPVEIERHTRKAGGAEAGQPEYARLAIRDEIEDGALIMRSEWRPSTEEIAMIVMGAPIRLSIMGKHHPPVMLEVGNVPKSAGVMDVDGGTAPSQKLDIYEVTRLDSGYTVQVGAPNSDNAVQQVSQMLDVASDKLRVKLL